jgi:hypothetical protein
MGKVVDKISKTKFAETCYAANDILTIYLDEVVLSSTRVGEKTRVF